MLTTGIELVCEDKLLDKGIKITTDFLYKN